MSAPWPWNDSLYISATAMFARDLDEHIERIDERLRRPGRERDEHLLGMRTRMLAANLRAKAWLWFADRSRGGS